MDNAEQNNFLGKGLFKVHVHVFVCVSGDMWITNLVD